jgi:hypothetical protein
MLPMSRILPKKRDQAVDDNSKNPPDSGITGKPRISRRLRVSYSPPKLHDRADRPVARNLMPSSLTRASGGLPGKSIADLPLPSAHGLVWDEARKCLWALGFGELLACEVANDKLAVKARHKLPDEDGHDLRAVPGSPDIMLSTHAGVWRFHRDDAVFRPDPDLKDRFEVKSADFHPVTGRLAVVQSSGENWWSEQLEFLHPAAKLTIKGETLYKARWLTNRP